LPPQSLNALLRRGAGAVEIRFSLAGVISSDIRPFGGE
jgi:hypothetical protein